MCSQSSVASKSKESKGTSQLTIFYRRIVNLCPLLCVEKHRSSNKGQQSSACVGIYIRLITACLVLYTVLQGGGEHLAPGGWVHQLFRLTVLFFTCWTLVSRVDWLIDCCSCSCQVKCSRHQQLDCRPIKQEGWQDINPSVLKRTWVHHHKCGVGRRPRWLCAFL